MRRVVAAEDVERAVRKAFNDFLDIARGAQGRVDLVVAVKPPKAFIRQRDVMWANFARNLHSSRLRLPEQAHTAAGADMLAMNRRIAELGKQDIPRDNDFLTDPRPPRQTEPEAPLSLMHYPVANERVVLAMVKDGDSKHPGIFDRATHDLVILHAMAIVRYGDYPGRKHRPVRRQLLAGETFRNGARGEDIDLCVALRFLPDKGNGSGIVCHRIGIGHAHNTREAASGGGARPSRNGLFLRLAGISKVDVHINQTRGHDETRGVYALHLRFLAPRLVGENSVRDPKIRHFVSLVRGIDNPSVGDSKRFHESRP